MKENSQVISKTLSDIINFPEMLHQPGSIGYLEKMTIGHLILISQPKLIIETGVFRGQTTKFISDFLTLNGLTDCNVVSFDIPEVIEEIINTDEDIKSKTNIQFQPGFLPESLEKFIENIDSPIDFAVIDADHAFDAVMMELQLVDKKLKKGGYIFCHDYRENDPKYEGTVYAIDLFASRYNYDLLPLNTSKFGNKKVVWGAALLRKSLVSRPLSTTIKYLIKSLKLYLFSLLVHTKLGQHLR